MKTYSRKNSSYLKKAFVASNFNEMCRLCLTEVDFLLVPIFQERYISYQELIQYSVDVLVEEGDGLPASVCKECLGMIEQSYLFKKKCQMNDSKLREHLKILELNDESRLNERLDDESRTNERCEDESGSLESDITIDNKSSIAILQISDTNNLNQNQNNTRSSPSHSQDDNVALVETQNSNTVESDKNNEAENENENENLTQAEKDPLERNSESEEINANKDDNFEVLNTPIHYSKIKRYEREKNKQVEKKNSTGEITENLSDKTESELILLLSEEDGSTSKNCQNEPEVPTSLQILSEDGSDDTLQLSKEEGKSNTTIIKVYSLVESDSDEDMEVALGGRQLVPKSDRIEEIVELWDNEEEELVEGDEEEEMENGVSEHSEGTSFLNTIDSEGKSNGTFQVCVEEDGVVKTTEIYILEKSDSLSSEPSEENQISGSKKTGVAHKIFNNCNICDINFVTKTELKDHMFSKHKDSLDYCTCTVCFKNFSCPNSLKRHMLVHTGTKPYKCEVCKRRFSQSSILKRHQFTHNESKPFQCHFCKKSYTQKMNLLIHLRNHGFKGQKEKYKCNLCDKKFVHHSGLSRHLKLHKGELSFCPLCNKSFTDSSAMLRHVRSIHKTDPLGA